MGREAIITSEDDLGNRLQLHIMYDFDGFVRLSPFWLARKRNHSRLTCSCDRWARSTSTLPAASTSVHPIPPQAFFDRNVAAVLAGVSVGDAYDNAMCESFFATLEMRTARPAQVPYQGRSPHGHLPVHRRLVQPRPAPLGARLPIIRQLRKERP